ncbi:MAG: cyclodeaminase/cyclohydrolase family protein, partial [Bacteroidales bacterium]|nr:cyclodeaminase/cyclohydrolase family protein [Bacteroidales bacterium]
MPADVAGFDAVDANTYVRRFTYPEELADLGIVGALSASLCAMVGNLTTGKKKYAQYQNDIER